jgi:guanosine-3',5'-bis(diphosphate) 3'-pyrophosphohydrolase
MSDIYTIIQKAILFACNAHGTQQRKDGSGMYITHPLRVMWLVEKYTKDETTLVAAVLHDVVEDTLETIKSIETHFGKEIADLVAEVTDDKSLSKYERKRHQAESMINKSVGAKMIKLADKYDNLQSHLKSPIPGWSREDIENYFAWCWRVVQNAKDICPDLANKIEMDCLSKVLPNTHSEREIILNRYYEILKKEEIILKIFNNLGSIPE